MLHAVGGLDALWSDCGDGILPEQDHVNVDVVERFIVAAIAQRASVVEIVRCELSTLLRILDDPGDLAANELTSGLVGFLIEGEVAT